MQARLEHATRVVVIGAGLAGLAAGATAAQAGASVQILDAGSPGGRARTEVRSGFRLNRGPHALFRGGPGRVVLARLGIRPPGHSPSFAHSRALVGDEPRSFLSGRTLGLGAKVQIARVLARLAARDARGLAGQSAREWVDGLGLRRDSTQFFEAVIRVITYVGDLDRLPATLAASQLRTSFRGGVSYLDGGWQQLVSGLAARATAAGAVLRPDTPALAVGGGPGAWEVRTPAEVIPAAAVVLAPGRPAAARRLLPADPGWAEPGPEVTAACLDLGLRRGGTPFILGIDEPLYLSPHCPPGDLAPAGCGLVHAMRYGTRTVPEDREQLMRLAAAAGIADADIAVQRFLPRMVVASALPAPEHGLAGRPPVAVPGAAGLFVAGDWVGPDGWLSDGSLASGAEAGRLASITAAGGG
jgi:phytoene dehydrogenase-like protein